MNTQQQVEEIVGEFDNKFYHDHEERGLTYLRNDVVGWLRTHLTTLITDTERRERERITKILRASYLMTNGYKDTDTTRTAMYIPNEAFNIEINKRLDFFIEQINNPKQ